MWIDKLVMYGAFVLVAVWTLIRKLIGMMQVWYFIVVPFRAYANNYVHNYGLQNGVACKRVMERRPEWDGNGWKLHGYAVQGGYIAYRKVNYPMYILIKYVIWGWLDNDSDADTYCKGHSEQYIKGTRKWPIAQSWLANKLSAEIDGCTTGSVFELGDRRADKPQTGVMSQMIWNMRNAAYNFSYADDVKRDDGRLFLHSIGKFQFGWVPDGEVDGVKYYQRIIGWNW